MNEPMIVPAQADKSSDFGLTPWPVVVQMMGVIGPIHLPTELAGSTYPSQCMEPHAVPFFRLKETKSVSVLGI